MADSATCPTRNDLYSPLGPTDIRLVEILPGDFGDQIEITIDVADLEDQPLYDALSYVWHPHDGTIERSDSLEIAIVRNHNSYPIPLGANLDSAIRHLRPKPGGVHRTHSAHRKIWIDALCINQDLSLERNHQVRLMKNIYSSAENVLIWLGPPCHGSHFVLDALSQGQLESRDLPRFMECLERLLCRDWFTRVWIAQELTLASQDPVIYVGHRTIGWASFSRAVQVVLARLNGKIDISEVGDTEYLGPFQRTTIRDLGPDAFPPALTNRARAIQNLTRMRNDGPRAPFSQRFFLTIHLQATDPRDNIFGLLGFSTFRTVAIAPDYTKSLELVVAETAATIMREDFCSYIQFKFWQYTARKIRGSVTWAPWVPNLLFLKQSRGHEMTVLPSSSSLKRALEAAHGIAPVLEISVDFRMLSTVGSNLGSIVIEQPISLPRLIWKQIPTNYLSELIAHARAAGFALGVDKLLSALVGPSQPDERQMEAHTSFLLVLTSSKATILTAHTTLEFGAKYDRFKRAMSHHPEDATIFMTDQGHVGIRPFVMGTASQARPIVAGLFGLNVPFVLQPMQNRQHQIVSAAYIANHVLGDENIESLGRDGNWRDLVKEGKLQTFTIQ
jgi:hypothetical protein